MKALKEINIFDHPEYCDDGEGHKVCPNQHYYELSHDNLYSQACYLFLSKLDDHDTAMNPIPLVIDNDSGKHIKCDQCKVFYQKNLKPKPEKKIIIDDCTQCQLIKTCKQWKKLTSKQRFTLTCAVGVGKFILKDCPLEDNK